MKKNIMFKLLSSATAVSMMVGVCALTSNATAVKAESQVTLKLFSNLPDRTSNQGKLEQMFINSYEKLHPNVKIEVEALQDEPYKQKFKAYAGTNELPDIYSVWGMPSFFEPVMKNGYALKLNSADYKNYGFLPGSLDGFSYNGNLYGLPRNTDITCIYYNKSIFKKYNVKVPTTFNDLISVSKTLRSKGVAPISMDGKDKWPISLLYQDLVIKEGGNQKLIYNALKKNTFSKDPVLLKAAQDLKQLVDVKGFQDSFVSADYGTAKNLFAQGKAAMYYMGEFEMGMIKDKQLPASFRNNLGVFQFPVIKGGKGKVTDVLAWNGGGYAISATSKYKNEAKKFLNYMMEPGNWTKSSWQLGLNVPAQNFSKYKTGKEDVIQKSIADFISDSTSISGTAWNDSLTSSFKTSCEELSQEITAGIKTPKQFVQAIESATKSNN